MEDMKDIIGWLRGVEQMASEVYHLAADVYNDDLHLKKFLNQSAEDETWHYHVMGSAAEFISTEPELVPSISVDRNTRKKIEHYFNELRSGLEENSISKAELIEKIVSVELSEWNDIFLYVVNVLKDKSVAFQYPAAKMQAHIHRVEHFLEKTESSPEALKEIAKLPPVWVENLLIVDDQEMITDLLKSLLKRSGNIDVAHNGQEALDLILSKSYKLIITDIDMPIMDGLTLYREATAKIPEIKERFLFVTGDLSPEREKYFEDNNTRFLSKPMDISVLKDTAVAMLFAD